MANQRLGRAALQLSAEGVDAILDSLRAIRGGLDQTKDSAKNLSQIESFRVLQDLAGFAAEGVKRLATEVIDLAKRGGEIAGVKDSFDTLARSVGETGEQMLGVTRGATKGLITDLDIMASANKALLLGLPVTSTGLGDLAKTATILGRAMKQDATKSLDDLITALGRSSPMILDNLGLTVKVGEANEQYAKKLGKTAEQLTEAEKKTAFYEAAMEAARVKVGELGEIHLTLGDRIRQAEVEWQNFVDSLAIGVTQSPVLAAGFDAIAESIATAFGTDQQARVRAIVELIEDVAIQLVELSGFAVEAGRFLANAFYGTRFGIFAFLEWLNQVDVALLNTQVSAAKAVRAMTLPGATRTEIDGVIRSLEELIAVNQAHADSYGKTKDEALDTAAAINHAFDESQKALTRMRAEMQRAQNAPEWQGPLQAPAARADAAAAAATAKTLTDAQKKELDRRAADLRKYWNEVGQRRMEDERAALDKLARETAAFEESVNAQRILFANLDTDAQRHAEATTAAWEQELLAQAILFANLETDATKALEAIEREAKEAARAAKLAAREGLGELSQAFAQLSQVAGENALGRFAQQASELINLMNLAGRAATNFEEGLAGLRTEGRGAASSLLQIGSAAVSFAASIQQATQTTSRLQGTLGGFLAGAATGNPFIAMAGALYGFARAQQESAAQARALRRAQQELKVTLVDQMNTLGDARFAWRALNAEFEQLMLAPTSDESLKRMAKILEEIQKRVNDTNTDFSDLAQQMISAGLRIPAAFRPALQQLVDLGVLTKDNAALFRQLGDGAEVDWRKMQELAEQYGISLDALGGQFQQLKGNASAAEIINAFETLKLGGANVGGVLSGMRDEISAVVNEALRLGTTVPENMRHLIDELARTGQLYTENRLRANEWARSVLDGAQQLPEGLRHAIAEFENLGKLTMSAEELWEQYGRNAPDAVQDVIEKLIEQAGLVGDDGGVLDSLDELTRLKFGEPVKTEIEIITEALRELIESLDLMTSAIKNMPSFPTVPSLPGRDVPPDQNTTNPGFGRGGVAGVDWMPPTSEDIIPAWLSPGEMVLSRNMTRTLAGLTRTLDRDRDLLGRIIPDESRQAPDWDRTFKGRVIPDESRQAPRFDDGGLAKQWDRTLTLWRRTFENDWQRTFDGWRRSVVRDLRVPTFTPPALRLPDIRPRVELPPGLAGRIDRSGINQTLPTGDRLIVMPVFIPDSTDPDDISGQLVARFPDDYAHDRGLVRTRMTPMIRKLIRHEVNDMLRGRR